MSDTQPPTSATPATPATSATQPETQPGPIALVGSGEYTPAMDETDRHLLALTGGPERARVALLPTAAGLEGDRYQYWNDLGLDHFRALGVTDIRPTRILDAASARDPEQVALIEGATFIYLSGGSPTYLVDCLRDSPAWEAILRAYAAGAALAGCSAGAMALGAQTAHPRGLRPGGLLDWHAALGVVPGIVVFPHFDRMRAMFNIARTLSRQKLAADTTILGIDEDTALVWDGGDVRTAGAARPWRVYGRQSVTIYAADRPDRTLHAGDDATW